MAIGVVALVVGLLAIALRDDGSTTETAREARVRPTVRALLDPEVHAFGEQVTARLELLVRKAELQPSTLRPGTDFSPYDVVGTTKREIVDFGALELVRYTITLQCLKQACLPQTQTGDFQFSNAGFTWRTPPPPGRKFKDRRLDNRGASATWPPLKVASRLTPQQTQQAAWRSNLADLPEPTYRIAPRWLAAGLLGGAAALVLAAAGLVAGYVADARRRRAIVTLEEEREAPPLEQALELLDGARGNGDAGEQRIALETLARELREHGESGLAASAERLAWSPAAPATAQTEVEELAAAVRRLDGAGP